MPELKIAGFHDIHKSLAVPGKKIGFEGDTEMQTL